MINKETRRKEIVASLKKTISRSSNDMNNQELLNHAENIEKALAAIVYESTHAEVFRTDDLINHIRTMMSECSIQENDTSRRLEHNMHELSSTIKTLIPGIKGEKRAKKAVQLLSTESNVRVLYNIGLADKNGNRTEYDIIVVTTYGLFVIEVKNWNGRIKFDDFGYLISENSKVHYDTYGRMGTKELLLKEILGSKFPRKFRNFILIPNEETEISGKLDGITVVKGNGLSYAIKRLNDETIMSASDVDDIFSILSSNNLKNISTASFNTDEIIEDFAAMIAEIELAKMEMCSERADDDITDAKTNVEHSARTDKIVLKVRAACISTGVIASLLAKIRR